jgi:hypothetical protein
MSSTCELFDRSGIAISASLRIMSGRERHETPLVTAQSVGSATAPAAGGYGSTT